VKHYILGTVQQSIVALVYISGTDNNNNKYHTASKASLTAIYPPKLWKTKQADWFLWPDCAPSSEHPQFGMPRSFNRCTPFNQNIPSSAVLLQQCHCWNHHRGKLQNLSPPSVLFESSPIFLQYTGDTDAKNDGPEFWNSISAIIEQLEYSVWRITNDNSYLYCVPYKLTEDASHSSVLFSDTP